MQSYSRKQLYALGEPLGDSATQNKPGGRVYGGGGGGGSSSTSMPTIADELKPLANLYTAQAEGIAQTPWQGYGGQRYADTNESQNLGVGMAQNRALYGDQTVNAGSNFLQNTLTSGPTQATWNPNGGVSAGVNNSRVNSGWNGSSVSAGVNDRQVNSGWNGGNVSAQDNPYAFQDSPYLKDAVDRAQTSVMSKAGQAAVRSGSFGNSGIAEAAAKEMGGVASQMYGNAWDKQAQLADANVSRNLQSQQFNTGITDSNLARNMQAQQFNSGVVDSNISRNLQAQQFNSGLTDNNLSRNMQAQQFNSGVTDSNLSRNMQAQQFNSQQGNDWASRNDAMYNNWKSGGMQAAGLGLQYGDQAYKDAGQLMNAGNFQAGQQQKNLDFGYQQFQDAINNPYKQMQATGGVVGGSQGQTTTTSGGGK